MQLYAYINTMLRKRSEFFPKEWPISLNYAAQIIFYSRKNSDRTFGTFSSITEKMCRLNSVCCVHAKKDSHKKDLINHKDHNIAWMYSYCYIF